MNTRDDALIFAVADANLLGIVSCPELASDCGVLIIVGGPQHRVGSHRQFLLLAWRLASAGYPVLRFDVRGMGDSDGTACSFDEVSADIGAAIDAFQKACPTLRHVMLWGLCDAASAALLYLQSTGDKRVAGLALLNPWVRSEASLAQMHIKHYYARRLMQRGFWIKLLSGKMQVLRSVRGFLQNAAAARRRQSPAQEGARQSFQDRMADGLRRFSGSVLLILSGEDYTAREFLEYVGSNAAWAGLIDASDKLIRVDLANADHTFSSAALRASVESATLNWLERWSLDSSRSFSCTSRAYCSSKSN